MKVTQSTLLLCLGVCFLARNDLVFGQDNRSFSIDWERNTFLKDGLNFRFIAGSFHYFRAHPDTWQRKLRTMRAAGLNAVTTYVEWSLHNPKDGFYVWDGIADLIKFIKFAIDEDLYVILRPGPYICAERDLGGFPFWLLTKYPNIHLRTSDVNYLKEVRIWYSILFNKISPYLYGNGGPIIMVQVENEYGSYYACDKNYRLWLRNETEAHVKEKAVLFTNDGPDMLTCGHIDQVLATLDFGSGSNLKRTWAKLRSIMPKGPLVNSEYYPGWLTHWSESVSRVSPSSIKKTFIDMLDDGANVNFYMFHGGTNFGFTSGSNDGGPGLFQPDITSYDYDAPMDEAGNPTPKYHEIREIIKRYLPMPDIPIPPPVPAKDYGVLRLIRCCSLLSEAGRKILATGFVTNEKPKTFEELYQYSGFVLYETQLPQFKSDPMILTVSGVRDRAYVFTNNEFVGIMSRETPTFTLPISASGSEGTLQILIENQGRINYGNLMDFKGIQSNVILGKKYLRNWNMTKFPMESYKDIEKYIDLERKPMNYEVRSSGGILHHGPSLFYGDLNVTSEPCDTYLDTTGWGKGVLFVNGENLGRYWPLAGPQMTMYVPREVLKKGMNKIVILELQRSAKNHEITLLDHHIWDS